MVRAHAGPQNSIKSGGVFYFIKMQNITTLIFDFGGVIINLKTEEDWFKEDLLPNFQPEKLQELQQAHFFQHFETGKISTQDFIQQLKNIAIDSTISDEEIIQHWNGILQEIPQHRVDLLQQLRKRYQLILLSNTNEIHVEKFTKDMQEKFGEDILETNFHTVYYSQEIGLRKPNKEIYEFVLREQKLQPEYCFFFDDKAENLTEPKKLGIRTMLIDFNKLSKLTLAHFL